MNRLILLGNGFDLAHGLPTSYEDFIFNICKYEILKFINYRIKKGFVLLDLKINNHRGRFTSYIQKLTKHQKEELITFLKNEDKSEIEVEHSNKFAYDLITEDNGKNWADIEAYFYKKLKDYLGIKNASDEITKDKDEILDKINPLNKGFETVKLALEHYLLEDVEAKYVFKPNEEFIKIFDNSDTKSTLLLNFNYTKTAEMYLPILEKKNPTELINIHGKLNDDKANPMIFGFGDEYDDTYKLIENFNDSSLFEHIKSFGYFKSNNYKDMERFVEGVSTEKQKDPSDNEDGFEVFIIGHSCGLSDRTLLKYIFEHENCKSIKIYHYQETNEELNNEERFFKSRNNYIKVTQEISRHFEDKAKMRNKIVAFDEKDFCPQTPLKEK